MTLRLVRELAADGFPVAVTCRVLGLPRSTFYDAVARPPSARAVEDARLTALILEVHTDSRSTYGSPRVHAELRLGLGLAVGRKRVARLMRDASIQGVCHRRKTHHRPDAATHEDLVLRRFHADGPDRVWFTDITQQRAADGWVYCCAVIDAWGRRVVGWSIADHIRSELVVDALAMARWQRRPDGTIVHADRGAQGGFNRSSQHLDPRGVRWDDHANRCQRRRRGCDGNGARTGRCGHRCALQGRHRISGRRSGCSGSRSPRA
jgi:transposase InsO family protein